MEFEFTGELVEWRGPAPYHFVDVPEEVSVDIKAAAQGLEYWGQVPVAARIEGLEFTTGLFPRDGRYLLPVKDAVRKPLGLKLGEVLRVEMSVGRR
ncbi:DUF1905 domain-containing protein [Nocardioides daphniae]|uniref:DUF1905 domain-containing protein n=1 Tax=Nocardioides daphniae TaxID=402297 RepID=A0A4P7U929_9ACTN|nr:DUF1905 domain-containing protein [Nocardioides daphniae]QCC76506.1 DUF1905 domain-containing protein [Nocardioides daphniae]GGD06064.1 hypothetical protein GCM10007231_00960 [Nocardioides daphniae]